MEFHGRQVTEVTEVKVSMELGEIEARALLGALSYYNMSAENNFQAGYGSSPEERELLEEHKAARAIQEALQMTFDTATADEESN